MFVSATIITRNEEHNIERCLNSLIGIADEIIVVDSYSTDSTIDICRRYGCKVTQRAFTGYGTQRQYAASLANGSYVLSVDADEVLSDKLRESIMELKDKGFNHRMYAFRVVNYVCGRPVRRSGMEPKMQVRLFDKRYAQWDLIDVGERLQHPGGVVPAPLEGDLHHYRCNSFEELNYKELRHAEMRGRLLAAAGIDAAPAFCHLRAAAAMLRCLFRQGAILDGKTGRRIAATCYKSTLSAYSTARRISNENNH